MPGFSTIGFPERVGDGNLGLPPQLTWTEFICSAQDQPSLAGMQCYALQSLVRCMMYTAQESLCTKLSFLAQRQKYNDKCYTVLAKLKGKGKRVAKERVEHREQKQVKEDRINPQRLEELKEEFNRLFDEPSKELNELLKKLGEDLLEVKISPADFKKATEILACLVAVDDGNRPQDYEKAIRADWYSYQPHQELDQGSFVIGAVNRIHLKTGRTLKVSVCNKVTNYLQAYLGIRDSYLEQQGIPRDRETNPVGPDLPLFVRAIRPDENGKMEVLGVQFKNIRNSQSIISKAGSVRYFR